MTCARDKIQKFKIRFKPVSKLFFINFFLPSFSFPRLFFFGSTCRGCRRRETFPLGYEFGEESSECRACRVSLQLRFPTSRQYGQLPTLILRLFAHSTAMLPPLFLSPSLQIACLIRV